MAVEEFIPTSSLIERVCVCVNVSAHVCIQGDVIIPLLHSLRAKGGNLEFTFARFKKKKCSFFLSFFFAFHQGVNELWGPAGLRPCTFC